MHLGGYDLKGLYALEEYYTRDLKFYYDALTVGPSHEYYIGRADADITGWVAYFIEGMALSFEKVESQTKREALAGATDRSQTLRNLDAKQRKALTLFERSREVTAKDIADLSGFEQRAAAALCQRWVAGEFLIIANASQRARKYRLNDELEAKIVSR